MDQSKRLSFSKKTDCKEIKEEVSQEEQDESTSESPSKYTETYTDSSPESREVKTSESKCSESPITPKVFSDSSPENLK